MVNSDDKSWSDTELEAAAEAYWKMQRYDLNNTPYSKRDVYRELGEQFGRTEKAFEYRMQNISAVLDKMGLPWIVGLKPASNVGDRNVARIRRILAGGSYRKKLPEMRQWLIQVAGQREKTTYGDLMAGFDIDRFSLRAALSRLGHQAIDNGEPVLTAVVVNRAAGRCSEGIEKEFGVVDDEAEREKLYAYWERNQAETPEPDDEHDQSLPARAARFARVKIRPGQARFRRAVFLACNGRCVLTDCSLDKALDAAHKTGRSWQRGHNAGKDGILLRKDLHALYDAGHLKIDKAGVVRLDPAAAQHYPDLHGRTAAVWA